MTVLVPHSLDEALAHVADRPDALVIAGGTDVMVEVNFGRRRVHDVISVARVPELREWSVGPNSVTIGAGVPYADMEQGALAALLPALAQAARTVGSPQIRATGTLGGNLGTCSPAGDGLPVLAALEATVNLARNGGGRQVPVADFMVGVKRNALAPGELITSIEVPIVDGWQGYAKVGTRNAMVIAVASACLVLDRTGGADHPAPNVRLAFGSVAPTVVRARAAEAWLGGEHDLGTPAPVPANLATEFGRRAAAETSPIDDHRSTATYRRHAVGVLATRLLLRAGEDSS